MKHLIRKYFEKGIALKLNLSELTYKCCSERRSPTDSEGHV